MRIEALLEAGGAILVDAPSIGSIPKPFWGAGGPEDGMGVILTPGRPNSNSVDFRASVHGVRIELT